MEARPDPIPWHPRPFSIAVVDSDETMADALCDLLRDNGFAATAFYDIGSLVGAHQTAGFDAYVLDYLADWQPESHALTDLVAAVRGIGDVPIFILGNEIAPEHNEKLGTILMRYKVRYLLRPLRTDYLARRVGEAIAQHAGL